MSWQARAHLLRGPRPSHAARSTLAGSRSCGPAIRARVAGRARPGPLKPGLICPGQRASTAKSGHAQSVVLRDPTLRHIGLIQVDSRSSPSPHAGARLAALVHKPHRAIPEQPRNDCSHAERPVGARRRRRPAGGLGASDGTARNACSGLEVPRGLG